MKKYLVILIASSLLFSCSSADTSKDTVIEDQDDALPIENGPEAQETFNEGQSQVSLLDEIPGEFIIYKLDYSANSKENHIDSIHQKDYISLFSGSFEAKKFNKDDVEYIAINNIIDGDECSSYKSFLLTKDEKGEYNNVFNEFYPNISLYSFYTENDIQVQQLEGDEQTVFAGYHFDLKKSKQLGIQFMFCNQNDLENTQWLNANSKYIYKNVQ